MLKYLSFCLSLTFLAACGSGGSTTPGSAPDCGAVAECGAEVDAAVDAEVVVPGDPCSGETDDDCPQGHCNRETRACGPLLALAVTGDFPSGSRGAFYHGSVALSASGGSGSGYVFSCSVVGGAGLTAAVLAGWGHSVLRTIDDEVLTLGWAAFGQLGRETEETRGLPTAVRRRVLQELKAVMAVYDAREGGPTCKTE